MITETIKTLVRKLRRIRRHRQARKALPRIPRDTITDELKTLLAAGDHVLLHSSLKSIGYVEGGARTIIECLLDVISPSGTLMVPTYSLLGSMYQTCLDKDYVFDPRIAGTQLGSIPAAFLKFPHICRSIHPTHSVSAIGKHAKYLTEAHHLAPSTYGTDSPWDRLLKLDGKIVGLGVTVWPIAFYHAVEDNMLDQFPLPVRMKRTYHLRCKDWDGNPIVVPVTPLDPKYAEIRIDHPSREDLRYYFWQEFNRAGVLTVGRVGQATAWIASAVDFFDHVVALAKEGITIYSSPDELRKRPLAGTGLDFSGTR